LIKKLLALVIIVIIAVAIYVYVFPAQATLAIDRVYNVKKPGTTILVNITISNAHSVVGWMIDLAWDPYILAVSMGDPNGTRDKKGNLYNIYEGSFTKNVKPADVFAVSEVDNKAGRIKGLAAMYFTKDVLLEGSGILATINFTVLHVGTTTIEIVGPGTSEEKPNEAIIAIVVEEGKGGMLSHVEIYGLVTDKDAPPIWESFDFQIKAIIIEVVALGGASGVLIWKNMPKKSKRKEGKEPIYENNVEIEF
jgi:hypothetical protein